MKNVDGWKEQESVKYWLQGLGERTKEHYIQDFSKFLSYTGMEPDQIVDSRMKDLASNDPKTRFHWEHTVLEYKGALEKKNLKGWTVHTHITAILSFFGRNRAKLSFRKGDLPSPKPTRHEWIPTNAQVRMVYQIASLRDKIGLLLSYQCGFSPVDVESLNIEEMPLYDSEGKIDIMEHRYFELDRSKTGQTTQVCLSNELLHDIDLYLRQRGYPKTGSLLISHKNERLSGRDLNTALKAYFKLALGKEGNQFHITKLRKAFQNALDNSPEVSKNYSELMMGHSLGVTGHYSKPTEQEIRVSYDQVFSKLSINGHVQGRSDLKLIGEEVKEQKDTLNLLARALTRMIVEQKKLEGLSLLSTEDVKDFLKRYVVFEEVLEKPPREKKRRRRTERKAT